MECYLSRMLRKIQTFALKLVATSCHRILSMAREVDFDAVKEQWYYLLGETYGT